MKPKHWVSLLSTIHFYRFYGTSKSPNCKICVFTGRPSQGADNYTPDSLQLCDLVLGLFSITAICKMLGRSLCACKHLILVKCDFSSTPLHATLLAHGFPPKLAADPLAPKLVRIYPEVYLHQTYAHTLKILTRSSILQIAVSILNPSHLSSLILPNAVRRVS